MITAPALILRPFAKINLTLHVGARRDDGFHDVRTLMQAIALSDRLVITRRRGPFSLRCTDPSLATDRTNLVARAAAAVWRAMGRDGEPRDLDIALTKVIPMAAGLGGGSADAAATLVGANRLWRARLPVSQLVQLAASLGSDVPFFLCGGAAFATGRGEEIVPVVDSRPLDVVVVKPALGVSTAEAYRWFDESAEVAAPTRPSSAVDLGWPTGPVLLANSLQGPVATRHPEIGRIVKACLDQGALGAAMSGSGSAVFGLFTKGTGGSAARRLVRPGWAVHAARTLGRRESCRLMGL